MMEDKIAHVIDTSWIKKIIKINLNKIVQNKNVCHRNV